MNRVSSFAARLAKDEQGAALVEYGLLIGLVAIGCVVALTGLRTNITTLFTRIGTALNAAVPGT
ncbi:MAG TPA: Flp family type IVb pilin [Azospirillum sp.]